MAIIQSRELYVRNSRGEWYVGSGRWSVDRTDRALKFSEPQYAWMDVGRFADGGTALWEEIDGEWKQVSETQNER
jgi:hypothetical protein